jgi:RND family efflux transporter MFP subunit
MSIEHSNPYKNFIMIHSSFSWFCGMHRLEVLAVTAVLLSACSGKPDAAAVSAGKVPVISISTVRAQQRDFPVLLQATGTVTPLSTVDVRSQMTSVISKVHFREGQFVRAGDLLFTLDARTEEANVTKALAQLTKDNATLTDARRLLQRNRELLGQNFISQGALDTAQSQVDGLAASILADQAAVQAAKVALSYARITAPQAGRAGAISVFQGSTVQANVTTLVSITQMDPIAIAFNLPQRNLPEALAALKGSGQEVQATLPDGNGKFSGLLQFVDNAVDQGSGTVKVKAIFKNPDGKLWPSAFVDVALQARTIKDAVVIPQAAVIQAARGPMVYTVVDGKASVRPVQIQYAQGLDAAVAGLQAGELVVIDGRQNLRPGAAVQERSPNQDNNNPGDKAAGASAAQGKSSAATVTP